MFPLQADNSIRKRGSDWRVDVKFILLMKSMKSLEMKAKAKRWCPWGQW